MGRVLLLAIAALALPALSAQTFLEYDDEVFLHDHETVRYRIDVDHGTGTSVLLKLYVRGYNAAPRVRVLDGDRDEISSREDNGADWLLDYNVRLYASRGETFFVDVDAKYGFESGWFDVTLQLEAPESQLADGDIFFDKTFTDWRNRDHDDSNDCAVQATGSTLPLAALGLLAALALWRRRSSHA